MIENGSILANRYAVQSYLNEGGMQRVYTAIDQRLDQTVALKTPLENQKHRTFQQSAQLSAKVNHHNVAKTFDYFQEGETPYLIEEFIDGETLEESILAKANYVDPYLAVRIFHQLAKGIAASHRVGVIHRDLKPSNILVSGGFNLEHLKITDFGIATLADQLIEHEAQNSEGITQSASGTIRGALPFMAPEVMFRTKGDPTTPAADIWSLGAIMFKVLTGQFPFGVGFHVPANIMTGKRTDWPPFMTMKRAFAPLASSLQQIVQRCLLQNPSERPTAEQIAIECSNLCSFNAQRHTGIIDRMTCPTFGFIRSPGIRDIFFHVASVYGQKRVAVNCPVTFSYCPGHPQNRAHPVLILN